MYKLSFLIKINLIFNHLTDDLLFVLLLCKQCHFHFIISVLFSHFYELLIDVMQLKQRSDCQDKGLINHH